MKVLCVAEKPSIARQMVDLLCTSHRGQRTSLQSYSKFNSVTQVSLQSIPNTPFNYPIDLVITSVCGHIMELTFPSQIQQQGWHQLEPSELFDCSVNATVNTSMTDMRRTLQHHATSCQQLWLWLDCDREGEAIAGEVAEIVQQKNPGIVLRRAVFNALTPQQIISAIGSLRNLDYNAIHAVTTRQELDLRLGCIFTRLLTINVSSPSGLLSYGPCQIPTLKIVVQRYLEYYTFQPSSFWYLECHIGAGDNQSNNGPDDEDDDIDGDSVQAYIRSVQQQQQPSSNQIIDANMNRSTNLMIGSFSPSVTIFNWERTRSYDLSTIQSLHQSLHRPSMAQSSNQVHKDSIRSFLSSFQNNPPQQPPRESIPIPTSLPSAHVAPQLYQPLPCTVISSSSYPTAKFRPVPLTTIQLQQHACKKLRMTSEEAMKYAELLYQEGYISYPRTETDKFSAEMPLRAIIQQFAAVAPSLAQLTQNISQGPDVTNFKEYITYAEQLHSTPDMFRWPRAGKSSDDAHPPIHPLKPPANPYAITDPKQRSLYNFVVRHFLACCSCDALGTKTTAVLQCGTERFTGNGLIIHQRNFLNILPWERWAAKTIPPLIVGEQVQPQRFVIRQGFTTAPSLHTESSLLQEMYRHGIGTDATMATHIHTLRERGYLFKNSVLPTPLGCALALALSIWCPEAVSVQSRSYTESQLNLIAQGNVSPKDVLSAQINPWRSIYMRISLHKRELAQALRLAIQSPIQIQVLQSAPHQQRGSSGFGAGGGGAGAAADASRPSSAASSRRGDRSERGRGSRSPRRGNSRTARTSL